MTDSHQAIEAIKQVKYRYLRALDTKHWDDFADTLTEDVSADYGKSMGSDHKFADRDSLVTFMRTVMPANLISEHRVNHPEITLTGPDSASGIWYLQDRVIVPDANLMLIGAAFYHDTYRRTADGWKISSTGYQRTYDATVPLSDIPGFKVTFGDALNR
ncbi:nuclear transport factor 2 family protein [Mycobacterium sp. SVM_VP21]|uniref:nuclear transport factor 2 family protein n=1 Tax=Mycolicibacter icosiumassiliensis TaxID=1792835 RepID=UPI000831E8B0|nr:nuclear transport factor 2 family protein [Mycolicibacter icosiumassiliensis]UVO14423.1 nuclear transport factor 2 family protein [Mycobacterium sp. SVM_VP21]